MNVLALVVLAGECRQASDGWRVAGPRVEEQTHETVNSRRDSSHLPSDGMVGAKLPVSSRRGRDTQLRVPAWTSVWRLGDDLAVGVKPA